MAALWGPGRSVSERLRPCPKGAESIEKAAFGTGSATLCWRSREKLSLDFCGLSVLLKGVFVVAALALIERLWRCSRMGEREGMAIDEPRALWWWMDDMDS